MVQLNGAGQQAKYEHYFPIRSFVIGARFPPSHLFYWAKPGI